VTHWPRRDAESCERATPQASYVVQGFQNICCVIRLRWIHLMTVTRQERLLKTGDGLPTLEGERRYPDTGGYYCRTLNGKTEPEKYRCTCVTCCFAECGGECDCLACAARWADICHFAASERANTLRLIGPV
jgi:hypothetical protein